MPSSAFPPGSLRPFWLPLVCALLCGALWIWSRQLPEARWEKSGPASPAAELSGAAGKTPQPAAPAPAPEAPRQPQKAAVAASPTAMPVPPEVSPGPKAASPSPVQATPAPAPSPNPTDAELAGPLPQHTQEELAASKSATPAPELDVAAIARDPQLWPKQVALVAPVRFSVIVNGAIAGNVQMPPGRAVLLRKVNPDGTVLLELTEPQGTQAKTKAEATDILARARALASARQKEQAAH